MPKKVKEKKPSKLAQAQVRILVLEGEAVYLTQRARDMAKQNDLLVAALRPFLFTASPRDFLGSGNNMTPCMIKDKDVQLVRSLIHP